MLCIPPQINRKLRQAIEAGDIQAQELLSMSNEERAVLLEKYVGKNYVENINKRFVSKFNTELSEDAVKDIVDSLARMNQLRAADKTVWSGRSKAWSREYVALQDRLAQTVNKRSTLGAFGTAKAFIRDEFTKIADQEGVLEKGVQTVRSLADVATSAIYKSLKASMDLSFALRQGFKVFMQSPKQWGKSMTDAFSFVKNIGNKSKMDALMSEFKATYLAHPNYEKLVSEGKLAFGIVEDWFPTTVAEKIPALGNIFKSSNDAFTVFSQSARFGIANDLLEKQVANLGRDLTKEELKSLAYIANSITGRGSLGRLESVSGMLNKIFFSARYISSQVDTFVMPFNKKLTPFARKEAMKHSVKILTSIGAILTTASFFGEVETDPRSSRFGKMKVGENWFDLTAGLGSYVSQVAKQASGETKSTATGKINKLNSGEFGSQTRTGVLGQWFQGKLAPAPSVINQAIGKGEMYGGEKVTPVNVARQLVVPITFDNTFLADGYLTQEDKTTALLSFMADMFGVGVTTPFQKK